MPAFGLKRTSALRRSRNNARGHALPEMPDAVLRVCDSVLYLRLARLDRIRRTSTRERLTSSQPHHTPTATANAWNAESLLGVNTFIQCHTHESTHSTHGFTCAPHMFLDDGMAS